MNMDIILDSLTQNLTIDLSLLIIRFISKESLKAYVTNIEQETLKNNAFRRVLYTTTREQLVVMSIATEIGMETHDHVDQFIRIEKGKAIARIRNKDEKEFITYPMQDGSIIMVPAGTRHNIINKGKEPLKLYTIYSPPQHRPGTVQLEKPENDEE
jgi:mannose-6-phosphate isomerase-like protein (cupin superfamily)